MLKLTYYTAKAGSVAFGDGAQIEATRETPGEIGRRKQQLAAIVERAIENSEALLILPGLHEGPPPQLGPTVQPLAVEGVSKEGLATFDEAKQKLAEAEQKLAEAENQSKALAEVERNLAAREESYVNSCATLEQVKRALDEKDAELVKREEAVRAASEELTAEALKLSARETELDERERALKPS